MTINEKLFSTLEKKKLKQSDLALFLNVSTGQVTAWKKRGTTPPAEYLINICKFLNISIYELLNAESDNELENIYRKLSDEDKAIVDNIFSRYKSQEQKLSTTKIG